MIEVSALLFTLLAEGTGLLSLILIIWIVVAIRKKGKDKVAATKLVSNIKKHADDRIASINAYLSEKAGLEAEELQLSVKKIDRLEKDFFTLLVRSYLKRDGDILAEMDVELDKVTSAYKDAVANTSGSSSANDEETINKIETLEKEKHALEEELRITKSTMGNMMTEFNTMFNGGNETVQTSKEALQSSVALAEEDKESDSQEDAPTPIEDVVVEDTVIEEKVKDDDIAIEDMDDDIFFAQDDPPASAPQSMSEPEEASAPKPISESEEDFGSIVSTDDVDDILDGIDLSKEIDDQ